ncbi:MAG: CCA tRNA nucleotidyltransferase [Candidatus Micrarchaeaceae archaeon]
MARNAKKNAIGKRAKGLASIESITEKVLKNVKPTAEEIRITTDLANGLMDRIKQAAPKDVEILLAGSVARGTQVRGNSDIDIFLLFPKGMDERKMEKKGIEIAKKLVRKEKRERFEIKYAEHPYLKLIMDDVGLKADIVPAFKIDDSKDMGSAVDRTQLHNNFVNSNLSTYQRDQVRVLKSFLRFHSAYGAEAKTEGFSGYLCELLIHQYGSFEKLINAFSNLKLPLCLKPLDRSEIPNPDIFKTFKSDFIVLDPTDSSRNVAAGVSRTSLMRFVMSCRIFLSNPSIKYFYGPEYDEEHAAAKLDGISRALGAEMHALLFNIPDISEEIIWQQLKRLEKQINLRMDESGFGPLLSIEAMLDGKAAILFLTNSYHIGSVIRKGPSVLMRDASLAFVKAHSRSTLRLDNDLLLSLDKSAFSNPEDLLRGILHDKDFAFPSYLSKAKSKVVSGKLPEDYAKMLYRRYIELTSI